VRPRLAGVCCNTTCWYEDVGSGSSLILGQAQRRCVYVCRLLHIVRIHDVDNSRVTWDPEQNTQGINVSMLWLESS
jgi:hypothetical protein